MNPTLLLFIIPALVTGILSYMITPLVIALAWRLGLIDDPKKNKHPKVIHLVPTPRGGGLAIFIAILLASLTFLPLDKHLIGILIGAFILVIMGILDDKYNLNPYLRLIVQFIAVLIPISTGIGIAYLTNPLGGIIDLSQPQIQITILGVHYTIWILSDLFALIWIVALINFLNIGAKAVPGQLSGVVAIAFFVVAALAMRFIGDVNQWPIIILASIAFGSFMGFLPWHTFPQRIMPSFAGSNLAGYLLGILTILSTAKVGTVLVVLAVPIIDTSYTIIRRVLSGKSPVWGDRGHLHHKLIDKFGLSQLQVAIFYWVITGLLGLVALSLNPALKLYTIIGVAVVLAGLLLWLTYRHNH